MDSQPRKEPALSLDDFTWGQEGHADDPSGRLGATMTIGGVFHHVEAYAVLENDDGSVQAAADVGWEDTLDGVFNAIGGDGPWRTVEINGRDYVIIITPFC